MKKIILLLGALVALNSPALFASPLTLFNSDIEAQYHCPNDVVVWLNLPTGIWHEQGARWYGRTKHGAFVCRSEAAAAGDRGSYNGS